MVVVLVVVVDDDGNDGDIGKTKTVHSTHILPMVAKQQLLNCVILFVHHSHLQTIQTTLHLHQRVCAILKKKGHNISAAIHASNV
jgi:hypothetical protein